MTRKHQRDARMFARACLRCLGLVLALGFGACISAQESQEISFNRDIRPILSDKCFHCHGPDSATRKGDLRLDQKEGAYGVLKPHDAEASELVLRILHKDPELRMPPPDSGRSLNAEEKERIKRWIQQGAAWEKHWAFQPPARPAFPEVKETAWIKKPLDRFVLAELKQRGLKPSPPAPKAALLRRVTFDLTGLPPTLAELDAFLRDDSPTAYERVVERLLASDRYGERMAAPWLDAARYADSHGYSLDRRRVMWPWRDWVIKAYNDNMPFDQFVTEQLAGDQMPNATVSQQVATGFNRNHPIQSEGGVINEEYRVETVVDRVETTGAVFLGLTLGCARCHDHKYEPISQREFYEFYSFFNNVPETAHVGNRDNDADKPFVKAPSVLHEQQLQRLDQRIAAAERAVASEKSEPDQKRVETVWVDDRLPERATAFGNGGGPQSFLFVDKADGHPVLAGAKSSYRSSKGRGQHGFQNAAPLTVSAGAKLFAYVFVDTKNPPQEIMMQWHGKGGWEHRAYWGADQIPWGVANSPSRKAMGAVPKKGEWVRLEVAASAVGFQPGDRIDGWAFTQFDGAIHWDKAGMETTALSKAGAALASLTASRDALLAQSPTVMVMSEMNPRRKTYVLNRGQYDQASKVEVQPAIPQVLGDFQAGSSPRLALAKWMTSSANPLTARVAVNRYWQMYFGTGLVATPEDFGTQGALPSHPALLDWLALEFIESGWDVKQMQKRIVMSATYRQSSRVTPEMLEHDPKNVWLARGPRFRLPAEMIRDQALAVSGLLVERVGGPSVRPYQPPGLWDDVVYGNVPRFQQDHGDKLYRRSLYMYWKRSVPPPNLQNFDAPSREACVLSRSRTNTPLAALVLMNDPTFVEASRKLAERAVVEADTADERLRLMFRRTTSRRPDNNEMRLMKDLLKRSLARYQRDPASAKALMQVGESSFDGEDPVESAAYTAIANALLSLDETITKN